MTEENNFNEKIANEDSKLDSIMSVLIILAAVSYTHLTLPTMRTV